MGVTGLWKLIEPCGQPIPVEMLESKVLAVDISIWLHQAVKGFQDHKGSALANAHLLGLFHRLCKLMYYRIKPVFVFDGKVPALKKETIAKRNLKRSKLIDEADRIQNLLLQSLAKEKVVQQALGQKATNELLKASPSKSRSIQKRPDIDDMFKLPELPPPKKDEGESDSTSYSDISSSDADSSFDESKPKRCYDQNLQAIDVRSKYFRNLPADIRHEILIDIKETRKQSSWGKLHELPSKSNEFSSYQMKRLLKRRQVQECLEQTEKEMDGVRTFTLNELENIFSEEGIIEPSNLPNTKQISSDSNTRFLLVRDLKKTLAEAAHSEQMDNKPETSTSALAKENKLSKETAAESEYDDDLQKAIQMSLEESSVYDEKDYDHEGNFRLNKEQRKHLKDTAIGLARAFMIEHAGMNDEDIQGLLETTQAFCEEDPSYTFELNDESETNNDSTLLSNVPDTVSDKTEVEPQATNLNSLRSCTQEKQNINNVDGAQTLNEIKMNSEVDRVDEISDCTSESDFEEVKENEFTEHATKSQKGLEIYVDPSKTGNQEDDIFADVFSSVSKDNIEPNPAKNTSDVKELLQNLKREASEITKLSLTDIKLEQSIMEISDDESDCLSQTLQDKSNEKCFSQPKDIEVKSKLDFTGEKSTESQNIICPKSVMNGGSDEVIEIIDDSDVTTISPIYRTPSKTKSISDFFETKYIVKRTPEKLAEGSEDVPKVKSPFFVKKTPKSGGKSQRKRGSKSDSDSPLKKSTKTAKTLFENSNDTEVGIEPLKNDPESSNKFEKTENFVTETKSQGELQDLASNLAQEKLDLEIQRNRQDRMGMTITERMSSECMQLLRLFGVPYIVAPMEAEAQCAFLDAVELTNGTITDDSDIWLFGGRTVYKNFFAQNKHVMEFKSDKIENSFNVDRKKLIQLALLVGSDYTTGINGIGAVTALEILATFAVSEAKDLISNQKSAEVLTTLRNFRDWWASARSNIAIGSSTRHRLRNKLKNIELYEGFPSSAVVEAYLMPTVDNSHDKFSWGLPDVESIREFTKTNFGWTRLKTDEILGPVLKKLNEKKSQATIKNYFAVKQVLSTKQMPVSKRVQNAINKMSADYKSDDEKTETVAKPKRGKRKQPVASTSSVQGFEEAPKKNQRKKSNNKTIKTSLEVIPQRQKDVEEMEQKKILAAAVLKRTNSSRTKK